MRLAGTAVVCIAAAFGAAFLVGRAVGRSSSAKQPHVVTTASTAKTTNATTALHTRLLAEFKPIHAPRVVKKQVRHHARPKRRSTHGASAVTATQSAPSSSSTTPASTYTAPTYSAPAAASSTPTHSSGSSGSGSGTTAVGGGSKSSGSGSGSTNLGG